MELLEDVLKITIPAVVVAATVSVIILQHFRNETARREQELKLKNKETALPLKFQAYERLVLLMERISINNMLLRLSSSEMSVVEFKLELMQNITHEMEHNLSQQLYVSNPTWDKIVDAKNYVLNTVNNVADNLDPNAPAAELVNALLQIINDRQNTPTIEAIFLLKKEAASLG
ncbi:MAG: hypothetical protein ACPGLV_09590 [Bacteroidia bacterium]